MQKLFITIRQVAILCIVSISLHAEPAKRPMEIHKLDELGLEIWTEYEPTWITRILSQGKFPIFSAESPQNYYPPSVMTWTTFKGMKIGIGELEELATSAIQTAAGNYGVSEKEILQIRPKKTEYNKLIGYEASFSGIAFNEAVDVKIFVGHEPGKRPVAMQAYTQKGKLVHLSEQIRRSWTNVAYLP